MINPTPAVARAKRFPVHASVRYRVGDSANWHKGRTENMSCSGALIAGRFRLEPSSSVEMILPVPSQLSGTATVQLLCRGRVVRVASPPLPILRSKFAVRWRELRVLNGEAQALRKGQFKDDWHALVHAMYNEIAVIVGSSELLIDTSDEQRRKRVAAIKQASDRTVTLLNRLEAVLNRARGD
jgi:signal transduction histidine kinase